jgi:hypothetical protein
MNLRPYQEAVIADFDRKVAAGQKRVILVCPTGGGKTVIAAAIIKEIAQKRRGVLVLAHRREIIAQTSQKLHAHGVPHGIIQAGLTPRLSRLLECSQCGAIRVAGEPCSACGFLPQRPPRPVAIGEGDLGLVQGGKVTSTAYDPATRLQWLAMLATIANERGYKRGWAAANYKEKFGAWPPYGTTVEPLMPTPECRSWVRSRLIAYAKRRTAVA